MLVYFTSVKPNTNMLKATKVYSWLLHQNPPKKKQRFSPSNNKTIIHNSKTCLLNELEIHTWNFFKTQVILMLFYSNQHLKIWDILKITCNQQKVSAWSKRQATLTEMLSSASSSE